MAFNPVKRIGRKAYPTKFQADLAEKLRELAELPPAPATPYLTVSLDWRPQGSDPEYRAGLQRFERESADIRQAHWPRGETFDSLGKDIERVRTYLSEELDPSAKGVFIVANDGAGIFEAMPLGLPVPTKISAGFIPALMPLARLDEDHPTYAVLLADQSRATISLIAQAHRMEQLVLRSSDYPRKQASGGWSQRRFQQRADERLLALARRITSETEEYLSEKGIDALIVAGDEVITGALDRVMSDQLRELVVASIRLDNNASETEILEATMPIAEQEEAQREKRAVETVNELRKQNGQAVTGSADVLDALRQGKVLQLVMNDDYHEDGWADFKHQRYGIGQSHDVLIEEEFDATPIELEEEMIRQAILSGAEIDIIHSSVPIETDATSPTPEAGTIPRSEASKELARKGGVGAILRYA